MRGKGSALFAARLIHQRRSPSVGSCAPMRKIVYSMSTSLDGFIAGPGGEIDWSAPDEELHRFHNERVRELGLHLCGRRLYETMAYWETADPDWGDVEREFARIWQPL